MTDDRSHDLAAASGAYVLHGMDDDESAAFEKLAARSEGLRTEVGELADTAVELGLAVAPATPRPELRAALLAAIEHTPQLSAEHPATVAPVPDLAAERSRRRLRPVAIIACAAAAAAIIAGVTVGVVLPGTPAGRIAAVQSASDSRSISASAHGGGTIDVAWSPKLGAATATGTGLASLTGGRVYELWIIRDGVAHPAGTFDGSGTAVLNGSPAAGDSVAMTVEPRGGSARPTTTPVASVAL
jgi:anti-sigma-K factor RskA